MLASMQEDLGLSRISMLGNLSSQVSPRMCWILNSVDFVAKGACRGEGSTKVDEMGYHFEGHAGVL